MRIYKGGPDGIAAVGAPEKGCWISLTAPEEEELAQISCQCGVPAEMLRAALDPEERSRIDTEDGAVMILINIPTVVTDKERELYDTVPVSVILTEETVITVCGEDTPLLRTFAEGRMRDFDPAKKTLFLFRILYAAASMFLLYLKSIDRRSESIEAGLHRSARNRQLFEMLKLQKSLVYFSASLRANESVMEKLSRTTAVKKYPEDAEILEDAIVENRQAMEMAEIYRGVLSSTTDAIAAVISNNQNAVMKTLAVITIVMAIPTIVFSAYGMNVTAASMPLAAHPYAFPLLLGISLALSGAAALVFSFFRGKG